MMRIPTTSDLKRLFAERGIRPNKGLGQHFLVDPHLMEYLVRTADLGPADVVLEPGAGTGGLTALLAARSGAVVAVEVDGNLFAAAADYLGPFANVRLIHGDVMARGDRLSDPVRSAVEEALAEVSGSRFKVVGNLPYSVSTALISALLTGDPKPERVIVTVQLEVAERLCSPPGSKTYGYLSVLVQSLAQVRKLKRLNPQVFWPPPEVEGCIIQITPDPQRRAGIGDVESLRRLLGAVFAQRRKQAAKMLHSAGLARSASEARRLLAEAGVPGTARPEQIGVGQFVRLAHLLEESAR